MLFFVPLIVTPLLKVSKDFSQALNEQGIYGFSFSPKIFPGKTALLFAIYRTISIRTIYSVYAFSQKKCRVVELLDDLCIESNQVNGVLLRLCCCPKRQLCFCWSMRDQNGQRDHHSNGELALRSKHLVGTVIPYSVNCMSRAATMSSVQNAINR